MLLLSYGFAAGVIAWAFGRRGGPWILRLSEPGQQRVRLAAGMLATAVGAVGIAVLGLQLGGDDHAHMLGWMIGAAVSLGGVVYVAGLLAWRGGQALGRADRDPSHAQARLVAEHGRDRIQRHGP